MMLVTTRMFKGLISVSLILAVSVAFAADVYQFTDENGISHFSDKSRHDATKLIIPTQSYRYRYKVKRVVDGDTILLTNGQRVRLLGINTPEIESRYHQQEQGGQQAKSWLEALLADGNVLLEFDQKKRDKYR